MAEWIIGKKTHSNIIDNPLSIPGRNAKCDVPAVGGHMASRLCLYLDSHEGPLRGSEHHKGHRVTNGESLR